MQSVILATISKSDLIYLFGVSGRVVDSWVKQGLPHREGRFTLSAVIRWREKQQRGKIAAKLSSDRVGPQELAGLLGVSRVSIMNWRRAGLPSPMAGYRLGAVMRWLRSYYAASAEKKYQARLAAMQTKLGRNAAQLQRFLAGGSTD